MSKGKTILALVLTGTCVGCSDFARFDVFIGGDGDVNESGPVMIGVARGVVSRPRGELTGTVKPSPHIPGVICSKSKPTNVSFLSLSYNTNDFFIFNQTITNQMLQEILTLER